MKAVYILIALFAFGMFVNVMSMTLEDDEMDEDEFNRGFSMADGIDETDFEKLVHPDVDVDDDDDQDRMADPVRVRIRVRRPFYSPAVLGVGGYAGLGGYAGVAGFGLAGRYGLNFDDVEDDNIDMGDEQRSSDVVDDRESKAPALSDDDIQRLADRIVRIQINTRRAYPFPRFGRFGVGGFRRPFGLGRRRSFGEQEEDLPTIGGRPNVRGRWMCRCPICGRLYECPGYARHFRELHKV